MGLSRRCAVPAPLHTSTRNSEAILLRAGATSLAIHASLKQVLWDPAFQIGNDIR